MLNCGNQKGLSEKLLIKPKTNGPQTERLPRSSVLDRLQSFLPQMAEANEKLKKEIDEAPVGCFDIENVSEAERIIEMDVALVELSGSGSSSEDETEEDSDSDELDSEDDREVTETNFKLPGQNKRKADIQVLEEQRE